MQILKTLRPALSVLLLLTAITGLAYPLLVTGSAQLLFPEEASGSLVEKNGQVVGSALIGQSFTQPQYFWGRPSATGGSAYNGQASSGSNLGPTNPALTEALAARAKALREAHPEQAGQAIPVDLLTTSASGLDPHISPASAYWQAARIARARHMAQSTVEALIQTHTQGRLWGILGEPVVNVLALNLALDKAKKS